MRILYAEDEMQLSMAVSEILKIENYEVDVVYDGNEAWEHLCQNRYDAAILDIMMPGMDGLQIVHQMRCQKDYTPVLLLTAKTQTEDRITGLSTGADDYLNKPFAMGELLARLNALLRRESQYKLKHLQCGNVSLNCETGELESETGSLRLSSKEMELLSLFMKRMNRSFSASQLLEQIWEGKSDENMVLLYVSYLNNKLKQIHGTIQIIQTNQDFSLSEYALA